MRMRVLTLAILMVGASSAFVQSSSSATDACTSMQVYLGVSPKHRETVMEYIAPRLKQKLGVDLVAEVLGSATMLERINAQLPNPRIAVVHWDVNVGLVPCSQGLCAPIDFNRAPNAGKLFEGAYTKDAQGKPVILATNVGAIGIMYNEEAFAKANIPPPTSWADLERPDLKGRISLVSPVSTWGMAALMQWAKLGGGGESNIDPGFARAQKLLPQTHTIYTWSSELSNLMQLGEVWVAVTGSTMSQALRAQGMKMKWILPKEGAPITNSGVSLLRNAPCEEAAYEYLNLYLSDEYMALRMRESGISSPAPAAWKLLSAAERDAVDLKVEDFDKLVDFDWNKISEQRADWVKRWQREIR